jgi:hypothetical protein
MDGVVAPKDLACGRWLPMQEAVDRRYAVAGRNAQTTRENQTVIEID